MHNKTEKEKQLHALEIGKGIQYLLNESYRILGHPILTHDMGYNIIAYAENVVTDDPIWNEYVATGTVSLDRLAFFKNESFLIDAANAKKITFLYSDKLKYDRIFAKLFNCENIQIGCACIVEAHQPFDQDDPMLFELFCDILNQEFSTSEHFRNYGQDYQEILIRQLIEEGIEDRETYAAHIESLYIGLQTHLNLAVVQMEQQDFSQEKLVFFRDLLKKSQPNFKYAIFGDCIVIIMSSEKPSALFFPELDQLNHTFEENNLQVGISSSFENLFELQQYYAQALQALEHGLKEEGVRRVFLYNEFKHTSCS